MTDIQRKKSPRAPSIPLSEAVEGALRVYEKEHRHSVPADVVAQHLGYKSANNGTAVKAIASIRYFGLFERSPDGLITVAKDVQDFQFSPDDSLKQELLRRWLRNPPVFAALLERFPENLPSDGVLRYELLERDFLPDAVDAVVAVFRRSAEFARFYEQPRADGPARESPADAKSALLGAEAAPPAVGAPAAASADPLCDRIPVRLAGGRRAWLEIPSPFYEADKQRLKNQIDLLLTAEDEAGANVQK